MRKKNMAADPSFFDENDMLDCKEDEERDETGPSKRATTENSRLCKEQCGIDVYSQEEIPAQNVIRMKLGGSLQCYDVVGLYTALSRKNVDALTRKKFTQNQLNRITAKYRQVVPEEKDALPLSVDQNDRMTYAETAAAMGMNEFGGQIVSNTPMARLQRAYAVYYGDSIRGYRDCNVLFERVPRISEAQGMAIYNSSMFRDLIINFRADPMPPIEWYRAVRHLQHPTNFQVATDETFPEPNQRNRIFINSLPTIYQHCFEQFQRLRVDENKWFEFMIGCICEMYMCITDPNVVLATSLETCLATAETRVKIEKYTLGMTRLWDVYSKLFGVQVPANVRIPVYTRLEKTMSYYKFVHDNIPFDVLKRNATQSVELFQRDPSLPLSTEERQFIVFQNSFVQDVVLMENYTGASNWFTGVKIKNNNLEEMIDHPKLFNVDNFLFNSIYEDCEKFTRTYLENSPKSFWMLYMALVGVYIKSIIDAKNARGPSMVDDWVDLDEYVLDSVDSNLTRFVNRLTTNENPLQMQLQFSSIIAGFQKLIYIYHKVFGVELVNMGNWGFSNYSGRSYLYDRQLEEL